MARRRVGMDGTVTRVRGVAPDARRSLVDPVDPTDFCEGYYRDDSRGASDALRAPGPVGGSVWVWKRCRAVVVESWNEARSAGSLRADSSEDETSERIAVTGPVVSSQPAAVDAFLSSALLWFRRTSDRTSRLMSSSSG